MCQSRRDPQLNHFNRKGITIRANNESVQMNPSARPPTATYFSAIHAKHTQRLQINRAHNFRQVTLKYGGEKERCPIPFQVLGAG